MAMATQSLTATMFATRAGTRILTREGEDDGARSLRRRRRRGGVATAQRNATHGRRRGARDTARAPRRSGARARARLVVPSSEMKNASPRGALWEGWEIGDDGQRRPLCAARYHYHVPGDATPARELCAVGCLGFCKVSAKTPPPSFVSP